MTRHTRQRTNQRLHALDIDFAAPGLRRALHRTGPGAWLLCVLALALCLAVAASAWSLLAQRRSDAAQLARADARANAVVVRELPAPQPRISEAQAGAVNRAVLQLNLPWRALHDAVAGATPASVALLALEPDARRRSLKITAEARTADDMIDYVSRLKEQDLFTDVVITRHEINDQDPNRPLRFQLEAAWMAR
ncbi:MAG: PilN domain-containing protein [Pseudomonadota bacterium]